MMVAGEAGEAGRRRWYEYSEAGEVADLGRELLEVVFVEAQGRETLQVPNVRRNRLELVHVHVCAQHTHTHTHTHDTHTHTHDTHTAMR
jgi:hypothetical protein